MGTATRHGSSRLVSAPRSTPSAHQFPSYGGLTAGAAWRCVRRDAAAERRADFPPSAGGAGDEPASPRTTRTICEGRK